MLNRKIFAAIAVFIGLSVALSAQAAWWSIFSNDDENQNAEQATEIQWNDLIPDDFVQPENPYMSMSSEEIDKLLDGSEESNARRAQLEAEFNYAPVVPELDGKRVRIPAYITPLEFESDSLIKEFLLVPYVGACIHTPPPPSNQIVHVESQEAIKFSGMYEPVWATGVIRTDSVQSELAVSGYSLEVERLEPYRAPQNQ